MSAASVPGMLPGSPIAPPHDLGLLDELPMSTRMHSALVRAMDWYLRWRQWFGAAIAITAIWVLSRPARSLVDGWWFDVTAFVSLAIAAAAAGELQRRSGWIDVAVWGKPAFGKAGGLGKRALRVTFRAAPDLFITFSPEQRKFLPQIYDYDSRLTEHLFHHHFMEKYSSSAVEPSLLESEWDRTWRRIKSFELDGISYDEIRKTYPNAMLVIPYWLRSILTTTVFVDFFMLVTLWFAYRWAVGVGSILPVLQALLVSSLLLSFYAFANRAYRSQDLPFHVPSREEMVGLGVTDSGLLDEAEQFRGLHLRIQDIQIGRRYFSAVRGFLVHTLAVDAAVRVVKLLILMACSLAVALPFVSDQAPLIDAYRRFALLVVLAPAGLCIGYFIGSLVIQDLRRIAAPIAAGLISALFPLVGGILSTGELPDDTAALISTAAVGLFSALGAGLAEVAKTRLESKGGQTSPASG